MHLESLYLFPVKSCAAIKVSRFRCTLSGPEWDREWMVVGSDRKFLTQRELPKLALVEPSLKLQDGVLQLGFRGTSMRQEIPLHPKGSRPSVPVEIWGQSVPAFDEGDAVAQWLSDFLGRDLRLVRITASQRERDGDDPHTVRFVDDYPLHLCTLSTLSDLNRRIPAEMEMLRFRPNLVLSGSEPWAEDQWKAVRIDRHEYRIGRRCERCTITTVDPAIGLRTGAEPLKTLAGFRRNARNKIEFGQYLHAVPGAEIVEGMEVRAIPV